MIIGAMAAIIARFGASFTCFAGCRLRRVWLRSVLRVAVASVGGRCGDQAGIDTSRKKNSQRHIRPQPYPRGIPQLRFNLIQPRIAQSDPNSVAHLSRSAPVTLLLFDLLYADGYDLRGG